MNRALDLLALVRYHAGAREPAPVGRPEARITVLTSKGRVVLTPKRHYSHKKGARR
jgi:hypothetical protein